MMVPHSTGPFLFGLVVGAAAMAVAATALDAHRRRSASAALGALEDGLTTLETDGDLSYHHMRQVGALRELAAGVRRGLGVRKVGVRHGTR